jgi:hypothetical protein
MSVIHLVNYTCLIIISVHEYEVRCGKIIINFFYRGWFGWFIVFNATFNNISVIPWRSVLLMEDPVKTTDLSQVTDKLVDHVMCCSFSFLCNVL